MGRVLGTLSIVVVLAIVLYALIAGGVDPADGNLPSPPAEPETVPPTAPPLPQAGRSGLPAPGMAGAPRGTASADQISITGCVTDVDSKKPIAGAVVRVLGSGVVTWTLADGAFSLVTRRGDTETVRVEAAGYPFALTHLDLRSRQAVPPLRVSMKVGAVVRGRVVDSRGTPVVGAPEFEAWNPDRVVRTGPEGRFALAGARTHHPTRVRVEIAEHVPVNSEVLDLSPGEVHEGVVLRLIRAGRIAGVVTDAVGAPAAGVVVKGTNGPSTSRVSTKTDARGGFVLEPLGPGTWSVRASRRKGRPVRSSEIHLAEGEVREGIELRFGWTLTGRVVDAEGKPVPGSTVTVRLVDADRDAFPLKVARVDMNGRFRVEVPWAREYELRVRRPRHRAECGGLRVSPGSGDVVLRLPKLVTIGGTVVGPDGAAVADFTVILERAEPEAARIGPRLYGGKAGRFLLKGLPPGRWCVVVDAARLRSDPLEVRLAPGEKETDLRFELRPGGAVRCRVIGSRGMPVEGAWVHLVGPDGKEPLTSVTTGASGACTIRKVRPGRYRAVASTWDQDAVTSRAFAVSVGETREITIRMPDR